MVVGRRVVGWRGGVESGVVDQDGVLQPDQGVARFDAEFLDQRRSGVGVDGERLPLPAGPVQREHVQAAQILPQRVRPGQGPKSGMIAACRPSAMSASIRPSRARSRS